MEQIKYQGYARDRGFNPIQVSNANVEAIAQQGNYLLRQMQQNKDIEARNRDNYLSGLKTAKGLEQDSRDRNFQLRTQGRENIHRAQMKNLEIEELNARNEQQALERSATVLAPLASLSGTIAKTLIQRRERFKQSEIEAGMADVYLNGPDPEEAAKVEAGLSQMRKTDELIQGTADKLQDSGAPPEVVRATRKISKWREVGRAKAMAQLAGMEYGGWLKQRYASDSETVVEFDDPTTGQTIKLTPKTAVGPDQRAAVNKVLFRDFMKEKGLVGVNPTLIADSLLTMKKQENQILEEERVQYEKAANEEELEKVNFQLQAGLSTDPVTAINEAIASYRHLNDENGVRMSPLKAFNKVMDRLVGLGNREAIAAFEDSPSYMEGKTWGELRTAEFIDARRKLDAQQASDEALEDKLHDQEKENWTDPILEELHNSPGGIDEKVLDNIIEQSKQNFRGWVDPRLLEYRQNSTLQARDEQEQIEILETLYQNDQLTLEEVDSGKYNRMLIDRGGWRQKAIDSDRAIESVNKGYRDQFKGAIRDALLKNAQSEGYNAINAPTYHFAEAHALKQIENAAKTYRTAGKSPEEAYSLATQDVLKRIEQDGSSDGSRKSGTYSFYNGEFSRWGSQGSGGQGGLSEARTRVSSVIQQVANGGISAVQQRPLLTKAQAQALDDPNAPIPELVQIISNNLPKGKSMSPFDIIDAQRKVHGLPPRERPYVQQLVESTLSPRLQELLNRTPTSMRSHRAMVGGGLVGPGQERQAISTIAQKLGVNPVDVATFINYETSGSLANGKYRRGLDIWGGDGGRYLGWIQFSPDNQQKYGVKPGMNAMQMADAVVRYLKDAGIRPGDGLEEMYQAVQGPNLLPRMRAEGRMIGRDSNGSLTQHVKNMQTSHRGVAERWLTEGAQPTQSVWRDPRLLSPAARRRLGYDAIGRRANVPLGKNNGIIVTSAVDASGEPGSDFVVEGGRRGAEFYFPYQAKVIEVVGNQSSATKGYGNYVDLEVRLPNGETADVRLAHFDAVHGGLRPGMRLPPGAFIGTQGRTGRTTGAHVSADWYVPGTNTPNTRARDFFLQNYLRQSS